MNALVMELLEAGVADDRPAAALKVRLRAKGLLVEPPPPERVPTVEEALEAGRGWGTAVSDALEADRGGR